MTAYASRSLKAGSGASGTLLKPVAGLDADALLDLTERSYIQLVE